MTLKPLEKMVVRKLGKTVFAAGALRFISCMITILFLSICVQTSAVEQPRVNPVAAPHNDLSCEDCHSVHEFEVIDETDQSCLECHADSAGEDSHPVSVPYRGPAQLSLSKEGNITCSTCHVLHQTKKPRPKLLRQKFDDLCIACHFPGTESVE